jgi:hypothetical protein
MIQATGTAIGTSLAGLDGRSAEEIRHDRHEKFLAIGRSI